MGTLQSHSHVIFSLALPLERTSNVLKNVGRLPPRAMFNPTLNGFALFPVFNDMHIAHMNTNIIMFCFSINKVLTRASIFFKSLEKAPNHKYLNKNASAVVE